MSELKQVWAAADGTTFDSKAEAQNHQRRPLIIAALKKTVGDNDELAGWLIDQRETVEDAFDAGTIKRVTKSETAKLGKALEALKELGDKRFAFITDNAEAVQLSFRWPSVKRMTDEEKATAARTALLAASDGNEELTDYVIEHKDAIFAAFDAGVEKRTVNPKAAEALAAYRATKAAEKAAAAEAAEPAAE
jgi:hypothetical protein